MAKETTKVYQNNPFYVTLEGLTTLFKKAQSVAILMIVLSVLAFFGNAASNIGDLANSDGSNSGRTWQLENKQALRDWNDAMSTVPFEVWLIGGVVVATVLFVLILIGLLITGVSDYTSAKLAAGKETDLSEALREVFAHIGSYLWLQIIIFVKLFLWTLLFIVPGIIMSVRYSLAGTSFFAKGTRGNEAVKDSLALTKGAWLTTFASSGLWNMMTFGMIDPLLRPGTNAVLYKQFNQTDKKPAAHWLSWLTLLIPIVFVIFVIGLLVMAAIMFALAGQYLFGA